MSSSASNSNTQYSRSCICVQVTVFSILSALVYYGLLSISRPLKLPEFSISHLNITNLNPNGWSAITVDIQVESHCDYHITYHSMWVYVLKNGRVISELSMPPFGQKIGESLALKARMVVPNGGGVGFDYWNQGGVLNFDIRVSANVDLSYIKELRVTCERIGVGFEKGRDGSMVGDVKHCLVHEGEEFEGGSQTTD